LGGITLPLSKYFSWNVNHKFFHKILRNIIASTIRTKDSSNSISTCVHAPYRPTDNQTMTLDYVVFMMIINP